MRSKLESTGPASLACVLQIIIQEGDPIMDSSGFYMIVTGKVEISHLQGNSHESEEPPESIVLAELSAGEVVDCRVLSPSVTALSHHTTSVRAFSFTHARARRVLATHPSGQPAKAASVQPLPLPRLW